MTTLDRSEAPGRRWVSYGLDAPGTVATLAVVGGVGIAAGLAARALLPGAIGPGPAGLVAGFALGPGVSLLATALLMVWGSLVGKRRLRDRVLDRLRLAGDERVLDVGCGHGLMLLGAARRLTRGGRAVGVDLWQREDQLGNARDATLANAAAEGVADRVELHDGDARRLPFPDAAFDVVLSSWAIHNIYDPGGRAAAIREVVRVLKPGGRAVVLDIRHGREYAAAFAAAGARVERCRRSFQFVIPTHVLWVEKPAAAAAAATSAGVSAAGT